MNEKNHLGCLQKITAASAPVFDSRESESKHFASFESGKPNRIVAENWHFAVNSLHYSSVCHNCIVRSVIYNAFAPCFQGIIPPRYYFPFTFANGQGLLHRSRYHASSLVVRSRRALVAPVSFIGQETERESRAPQV
jgi:hypothetical protein